MTLLAEAQHRQDAAQGNRWAGKVKALGTCAPWWNTAGTVAVVEIAVGDVFTVLCHVNRGKSGRLFANAPSARRGDSWVPAYDLVDGDLAKMVQAVAVQAAETFLATAPAQPEDDADSMPF